MTSCLRLAPSHPAGAAPSAQSGLKVCQPETSLRPSPSARLLACLTCLRLASGPAQPATRHPASGPSVYETGLAAQVPGATSSHGFAALWLRLASGPAQPATHLSPACPAQAPAHLRACQPLGRPPAPSWHHQTQPSVPRSGLSNVSETGLRPTTSLTAQAAQPKLTVLVLDFKPSKQDGFRTSNWHGRTGAVTSFQ